MQIQQDVFGMNKKKAKAAAKAIGQLGTVQAATAIFRYRFFLKYGGKRPNIHDAKGRVIAPVCPQLVQALVNAANHDMTSEEWIAFEGHLAMQSKRQVLRHMRADKHAFNRAANVASARHDEEISAPVAAKATIEDDDSGVDIIRLAVDTYGSTEVLSRSFRDRTVVVIFWEGRDASPKKREVVEYTATAVKRQKAGNGNRLPVAKLESAEWKWGKLADHIRVIEFLAEVKPSGQKAA